MIKSMTGFGKASLEKNSRIYHVEIRSVNHRYLDISVKIPRALSYLEEAIKNEISTKVKRGKIDVIITFENHSIEGRQIKINTELAKEYIKELRKLAEEENLLSDIHVNDIARYPEVLTIQDNQDDEVIKLEILEVIKKATESLVAMREIEGKRISEDLKIRLEQVEQKVNEVSKFSTGLIEEYVVKLEERVKKLLKEQEIDKARLAEEVVIYADKCSIEEEITRLKSHLSQFQELLNTNEAVRKKIRFYNTRDE